MNDNGVKLLKGGLVWNGDNYAEADVLVRDGKIASVGSGLADGSAEVIDVKGLRLTPGLIDAHTHIGVCAEDFPEDMTDCNDMIENPITPQLRALDAVYTQDTAFADALAGGVTCVQTLPGSGNIIGGQGVIIKTKSDVMDKMTVVPCSAMKAALGENPIRVYTEKGKMPSTRMGNAAMMRAALIEAANYAAKRDAAEKKDEPFDRDLGNEALAAVLKREMPFRIHCHRVDDIQTAVRVAEEFNLKYSIEHCTEGHFIADWLAEKKVFAAVGPTLTGRSKIELRNKSWQTPRILMEAGVHVCLITDHPVIPIGESIVCAALAVRAGLSERDALRAVTVYAAEHLGIADRVGSIAPGKDADIAVWDGDPLDARTHVCMTFISGELVYSR